MRISNRIAAALASAALLSVVLSGVATANASLVTAGISSSTSGPSVVSKTIDTEGGNCGPGGGAACSTAAVYGANGFTGTLTFSGTGTVTVWDYLCVHTPSTGAFQTFGGTYTFSLFDGSTALGSTTYTLSGGSSCTGSTNYAAAKTGITFTVPSSKTVGYTLSLSGITAGSSAQAAFSSFNSIRNEAYSTCNGVARSYSVPPPTNFIIPEAPFAVLLPLSAGLLSALFLVRRPRKTAAAAA